MKNEPPPRLYMGSKKCAFVLPLFFWERKLSPPPLSMSALRIPQLVWPLTYFYRYVEYGTTCYGTLDHIHTQTPDEQIIFQLNKSFAKGFTMVGVCVWQNLFMIQSDLAVEHKVDRQQQTKIKWKKIHLDHVGQMLVLLDLHQKHRVWVLGSALAISEVFRFCLIHMYGANLGVANPKPL